MKAKLFEPMVSGWSAKLSWSPAELDEAARLLLAISKANGGEVLPDVKLDPAMADDFALRRANDALARRVMPYAGTLRAQLAHPKYYRALDKQAKHLLPELAAHEWLDCIDMNTADADTLCRLPKISRPLAQLIISHRRRKGAFTDLEQLKNIEGITEATLNGFKYHVSLTSPQPVKFMTPQLAAFISEPTFKNYVASVVEGKGSLIWSTDKKQKPVTHLLAELKSALQEVEANKYGVAKNLHYTRASQVLLDHQRREKAKKIAANQALKINTGALLPDALYLTLVNSLLGRASRSIHVMMFFMKYEEGSTYIANALVDALIAARKKGLDVKVILDKDAKDDVAKSALINESVFQVLKKNQVAVVYDGEGRMTHSKLVVVDGRHVVLGSHNWTGGSLLAYDDTSVYIESEELGQKYQQVFDGFWGKYSPKIK
jgi:hypothetical protein